MARTRPTFITVGVAPHADAWRQALLPFLRSPDAVVTGFAPERLALNRDLLREEHPFVDVVEFGTLTGRILAKVGYVARSLPSRPLIHEAIARASQKLPDNAWLAESCKYEGTLTRIAETLQTFRHWNLNPSDAQSQTEGLLNQKLAELSQIRDGVETALGVFGRGFNHERMAEMMELPSPLADPGVIVVMAGDRYYPVEHDWLRWVAQGGQPVVVMVDAAPHEGLFGSVRPWGGPVSAPAPNPLAQRIFRAAAPADDRPFRVRVMQSPDPLAEAEWIIRDIAERLNEGHPANTLGIFVRRREQYQPLLFAAARRHGVPFAPGDRIRLPENAFCQRITELLKSLAQNSPRDVGRSLVSSYFGLETEARAIAVNAAREAGSGTEGWARFWDRIRTEVPSLSPLADWHREAVAEERSLDEWVPHLESLTQLEPFTRSAENPLDSDEADSRAAAAMVRALSRSASFARLESRRPLGFRRWVETLSELWPKESITLPASRDTVRLSSSAAGMGPVTTLYGLGMLEGVFPRRRQEDTVLTDRDWDALSALQPDRPPFPTSRRTGDEERDEFYRLVCQPTRQLVLSYPVSDGDRESIPAFFLQEVREAVPVEELTFSRRQWTATPPRSAADQSLAAALMQPRRTISRFRLESAEAAAQIADPRTTNFDYRRMDDALDCAFRHLVRHVLKVESRAPRAQLGRLLQLPIRAQLAKQPHPVVAIQRMHQELDELVAGLAAELSPSEEREMRIAGRRMVSEWVKREFAARELWPRQDTITDPVGFDQPPFRNQLKTDTTTYLTGSLPALSKMGESPLVHLFRAANPLDDDGSIASGSRFLIFLIQTSLKGSLIEIDSTVGKRTLIVPNGAPVNARSDGADFVRRQQTLDDDIERRKLNTMIQRSLAVIRQGLADPTPSADTCRFCDFGELCRSHADFSDVDDPFAGMIADPAEEAPSL